MRKPRRSFAAPLILTAAIPACVVASNKPDPNTTNHKDPEQRDHRDPEQEDPDVREHRNPPRPEQFVNRDDSTYDQQWTLLVEGDGTCMAYSDASCPENTKCNPPPPRSVACPEYIESGETWSMWSDAGSVECFAMAPMGDCPEGASCNPPPPQRVSCPE